MIDRNEAIHDRNEGNTCAIHNPRLQRDTSLFLTSKKDPRRPKISLINNF